MVKFCSEWKENYNVLWSVQSWFSCIFPVSTFLTSSRVTLFSSQHGRLSVFNVNMDRYSLLGIKWKLWVDLFICFDLPNFNECKEYADDHRFLNNIKISQVLYNDIQKNGKLGIEEFSCIFYELWLLLYVAFWHAGFFPCVL